MSLRPHFGNHPLVFIFNRPTRVGHSPFGGISPHFRLKRAADTELNRAPGGELRIGGWKCECGFISLAGLFIGPLLFICAIFGLYVRLRTAGQS